MVCDGITIENVRKNIGATTTITEKISSRNTKINKKIIRHIRGKFKINKSKIKVEEIK